MKVTVEEAEENKVTIKETNFDNIIDSTFKLGHSDLDKKNRTKVLPPHFSVMKDHDEDEEETDEGIFLDDE